MEKEISLREFIEIFLKSWKIIVIVTGVCILIAGVISFYIMEPSYNAKTVLMASYATDKLSSDNVANDDLEGILDLISGNPTMTLQTYKEQLNSPVILQETIDELELEKKDINVTKLMGMISLDTIQNTNLIAIHVTYSDPNMAAAIANTLANRFTDFITNMSKERTSKSSEFLEAHLEIEKAKLDEASLELKQFLSQPRGVDELQGEVSATLSIINSYKTDIIKKEVELIKIEAGIEAVTVEIQNTPEILITKKSLDNDSFLNQIVLENENISIIDTSQLIMESEEINENYQSLKMKLSNLYISKAELEQEINEIKVKIDENQLKLEVSQQELAEKNYEKKLIDRKVNISNDTYNTFLQKYEESLIAESTKLGESSIDIVSNAMVPEYPIGPRKLLNLVLGAALGFIIGIFVTLFRAYWKAATKPQ